MNNEHLLNKEVGTFFNPPFVSGSRKRCLVGEASFVRFSQR